MCFILVVNDLCWMRHEGKQLGHSPKQYHDIRDTLPVNLHPKKRYHEDHISFFSCLPYGNYSFYLPGKQENGAVCRVQRSPRNIQKVAGAALLQAGLASIVPEHSEEQTEKHGKLIGKECDTTRSKREGPSSVGSAQRTDWHFYQPPPN